MKKILITGANSDLAKYLILKINDQYEIYAPNRNELDVTSIHNVDSYISDKKFDVLINCAGSLYSSLIVNSEPNKWINDINVNLVGTYLSTRKVLINNPNADIINISSTAAFNTYKDWSSYCSSKSAVLSFSGCLFKDGYKVYTLCPGAINTKIRNNLNISNDNLMTLDESIIPILDILSGKYKPGDIVFYRKNMLNIKKFENI